jgi:carboxylesterase type B
VQGRVAALNDRSVFAYAFYGIPFAAPPVGELRFKPPQPVKSWKGIRDVSQYGKGSPLEEASKKCQMMFSGPACPQDIAFITHTIKVSMNVPIDYAVDISEDCLSLDVFTSSLTGKRPVMVYIHGGGLTAGW